MRPLNAFAGFCLFMASAMFSTVSAQCPPDTEAPVISNIPAPITMTAEPGLCGATVTWAIPQATDNCEVTSFSADQVPNDFYSVGITTVNYTAMDAEGNMAAASFTITITDDEDPSISDMPDDISVNNDSGNCSAMVTWSAPTGNDNCNIASLTSDHDSGDTFPEGTTTVTYTATDVNGNSITDSFDITVTDNENPTATAQDLTLVLDASGMVSTTASAVNNGSSDNCSIASIDLSKTDFDCDDLGTNTVILTVTDIHSNQSTATATITVQDNQTPVIAQMADINANNDAGNCSAIVTWTDPAVTENCTNTLTSDIASGTAFDVGVTTVTYTAEDVAGNSATMSFDVTVTDTQDPTISGLPTTPITQGTDAGVCTAAVTWSAPTASDNCTTDAVGNPANVTLTSTHQPGSDFTIGTTMVTYTAIDIYGNTSTASFNVIVTSTDSDSDGICDTGDNCSDTDACNYADPANEACETPVNCDTCSDGTGTGTIVDNDADNDGVCDADEVVGCQDNTACNYNAAATDAGACTFTDGICESCSGETDGTGTVVDNDADDDGVCDADEVAGCQDNTACNYNSAATDAGACTYTSDPCDTCSGATDGTGTVVDNDSDSDGVCDADEVVGCMDSNACNYNAAATDAGACAYTDGICETCVAGAIVDNDADDDGVCDDNEITGCTDSNACNYDSDPTTDSDNTLCTYTVDLCDTCSGETDGTGTVVDNDADNDGVCDDNEMTGCTDSSACNYDSDPTTDTDNTLCAYTVDLCDTCSGETDGTGTVVDNDADNDGVCDDNEITGCTDSNACNYDSDPTTDSDNTLCTYTVDLCDTCSGETDGTGTVVDNDADNDGVCDADEVDGCTDPSGCNYNADPNLDADVSLCVYATGCETCSGETDGTGTVLANDDDSDGVCNDDEIAGCQDDTACNYNSAATDSNGSCTYASTACETCSGATDGSGTVLANDDDSDGVCNADEIAGCEDATACNYNSAATDSDGSCTYTSTACETCSGATDGSGTIVANDDDSDGVCNADEIAGCEDATACNYNSAATDSDGSCTYTSTACETCSGATDGSGTVVANDDDSDGVCNDDEIAGCQDDTACNYNSAATDSDGSCTYASTACETCSGATDGSGTVLANDDDSDGICNDDEITGCTDASACNYNDDPNTDSDESSCIYANEGAGCTVPSGLISYQVGYALSTEDFGGTPVSGYVVDLYVDLPNDDDILLNVYNMNLTNSGSEPAPSLPSFYQGLTAAGWAPNEQGSIFTTGVSQSFDSFIAIGGVTAVDADGNPIQMAGNGVAVDPNFPDNNAEAPGANAGWYNGNPVNQIGQSVNLSSVLDGVHGVFIGRFSIAGSNGFSLAESTFEITYNQGGTTSGQQTTVTVVDCDASSAGDGCETCSGETDGTGTVLANDDDSDGVCNADEIAGCEDDTACNYNSAATDSDGSCIYTSTACETCSGATDGSGTVVANDDDSDGVCNADEIAGCEDDTACNYNSAATDSDGSCIYPTGCETCSGETDGSGTTVANDDDSDGVCNDDEITGCTDASACNYDSDPTTDTDNTSCAYTSAPCDYCSGATDGTGTVMDGDADNDGTCDSADGCPNDPAKTDPGVCGCGNIDTDVDNDGVCDDNDLCTDPLANNYQSPGGEECESCPNAPIFDSIYYTTAAMTLSSADGAIALDISGNAASTLYLEGINGAPDYTIALPDDLNDLEAGYYIARVQDSDGCWGVADTSVGGTTLQQPAIQLEVIIPFTLCCSGCGINDIDADGICDDDDNCTDQSAPNFDDPANTECLEP